MNATVNLESLKQQYSAYYEHVQNRIIICAGTGCIANGSMKVYDEFIKQIRFAGLEAVVKVDLVKEEKENILVSGSGCQGFCQMGPLVTILPEEILYCRVKISDVEEIVTKTLFRNEIIERLLYIDFATGHKCRGINEIPFYTGQKRTVLRECGRIDPEDLVEYVYHGGYKGARRALTELTPEEICRETELAGLRGRGGGGFPTGKKWALTLKEVSDKKYVICNGDEGDPGAFMDRSIMEGNPHSVIEGMIIAGKAIGADEGFVYVRAEYPLAVKRIKKAVETALNAGLLGSDIFGSGFGFKVNVMEGAGAFVCGEETALMASVMGRRGMPNPKPPFPAQKGLFDKPTVINNVETLASVPMIIREGYHNYRSVGTENSPGTKTFALTGHVINTGLIEVPFGTPLKEIIFDIGGGVTRKDGKLSEDGFKAVQIGGPSGGCLTKDHLDLKLDFDSLTGIGAMVGSGGLVVMNHDTCMVKVARYFMQFTQNESCGKCVLCREGTKQMLALLDDITEGNATMETLDLLEELALAVKKGSLCGLGKTAPNPVLSLMKQFREEWEIHVTQKRCPTKQCKALLNPVIIEELCRGCGVCIRKCPAGAITGEKKQPHKINDELCIRCGACIDACRFNAVVGG